MTDYYGFATISLKNAYLRLDMLKEAGPRLVRLIPAGGEINLFAEVPGLKIGLPPAQNIPFGGHRLWRAPEVPAITYLPDDSGCLVENIANGYRLSHEDIGPVHYRRTIEVTITPAAPVFRLTHRLTNLGNEVLNAAPWALTMFRMGSRACLPMSVGLIDGLEFTPTRSLVLWPYTDLDDERLFIGNKAVLVSATPKEEALKVGLYTTRGWAAIEFAEGWVVIKRFSVHAPAAYTDLSANVQCYVRDRFIELETLGELKNLGMGESVSHVEEWELKKGKLDSLGLI